MGSAFVESSRIYKHFIPLELAISFAPAKQMAKDEHLSVLTRGVEVWNRWREENIFIRPDLRNSDLLGIDLSGANLSWSNFNGANLNKATLIMTDLRRSTFGGANLQGANLARADLSKSDFTNADLGGASLRRTAISGTNFNGAILRGTDFSSAYMIQAVFANNDLSEAVGLDTVRYRGPSAIGIDTLYKSGGNIPLDFLRGGGVPEEFIASLPPLVGARHAIQSYSCFISY